MLDCELEIVRMEWERPEPLQPIQSTPQVRFVPRSGGLCIDGMGEIAASLELSGQFLGDDGNPAPYVHIAHALEQAFHFSFGNAYKSKERVFKRKPYNLTKALDCLKNLIVRAGRKQDEKR
jgi:hypothetical protein